MALSVGTTHHVKLGDQYLMLRPGSYTKKPAPQFGARITTGDPGYNNLSIWQHLVQKSFIGGLGQDVYTDNKMYAEGVGIDTTADNKTTLSRGLGHGVGANWALGTASANGNAGHKPIVYNEILYVLSLPTGNVGGQLWQYNPGTDGWVRITALDASLIRPTCIATFHGKLYVGGESTTPGTPKLVYSSGDLSTWSVQAAPAGVPAAAITAMGEFQQRFYVAYQTQVWRLKIDLTWDGSTVFYDAMMNSTSNYMVAVESHLGFLYMLSKNGHVHRTDGNTTFDLWSWGGETEGVALASFDGKLFILAFEYTGYADVGWCVLYQMTGSAMTQLKRWGRGGVAVYAGALTAYDRKLWYGASGLGTFQSQVADGFGVACYDPVEDAHSIPVTCMSDTAHYPAGDAPYRGFIVDGQVFFCGRLYVFVRGFGVVRTLYAYLDDVSGDRLYDKTRAFGDMVEMRPPMIPGDCHRVVRGDNGYLYGLGASYISVIDSATNALVTTIPVAANDLVDTVLCGYLLTSSNDGIRKIDSTTFAVVAGPVAAGVAPGRMAWCWRGTRRVYIQDRTAASVVVFDTEAMVVMKTIVVGVGTIPAGIVFVPAALVNSGEVYTAASSSVVKVIDASTDSVVASITVDAGGGQDMLWNPDLNVVCWTAGSYVSIVNCATRTWCASAVTNRVDASCLAYDPVLRRLYVGNYTPDVVSVVDASTLYSWGVMGEVPTPGYHPLGLVVDDSSGKLYMVGGGSVLSVLHALNPTLSGGWLVTSEYDAGTPGLEKLWRKVVIDVETPIGTAVAVQYSIDAGKTWYSWGSVRARGGRYRVPFYLDNVRSPSLRLRFILSAFSEPGAEQWVAPVFYGFAVSYLPMPEPNWIWTFTVPVADKWLLMDGTEEVKDTNALIAYLEGLWRAQVLVSFTDVDGTAWAANGPGALVYDMSVVLYDAQNPREGDVRLTILEAVESY